MKQVLKISMAVLAISSVTFFTACNNSGDKTTVATDSTKTEVKKETPGHEGHNHD